MALLTIQNLEEERNIDLTDPNGQLIAESLIDAAVAWVTRYVGYEIEESEQVQYFSDGYTKLWLYTKAPVSAVSVERKSYNGHDVLQADAFDWTTNGEIEVYSGLPRGLKAVKVTFTAGWTAETLPEDLRGALLDIVALKLQEIANFSATGDGASSGGESGGDGASTTTGGQLKRFTAGDYTEEYSTAGTDAYWRAKSAQLSRTIGDNIPAQVREVVAAYRLPLAR